MKILLGRGDVNPNKPDSQGQTPLQCATQNGHEGVVKILLGRGNVNPNEPDKRGRKALWCATKRVLVRAIARLQPPEYTTPT